MDTHYRRILYERNMIQSKHQPRKCERRQQFCLTTGVRRTDAELGYAAIALPAVPSSAERVLGVGHAQEREE
jgi:hypothetical protein